eukprot:gene20519-23307_t
MIRDAIAPYAVEVPFTNEFFCAESAGQILDSNKGITQRLELVPEAEDAKFDKLMERYLSTGVLSCEEVKFVNYMSKFFTYRFCSIAKLRYWDYEGNEDGDDGHAKDLSAIAFHPDGSLAMTADAGGVALLWDIRSGQMIQGFQGHIKKISSVSFSANGFHAATSSLDNTVKIWDLRRRRVGYTLPAHTNIVSEVRYSPSGEQLLTCSFDNTIKLSSARDFSLQMLACSLTQ